MLGRVRHCLLLPVAILLGVPTGARAQHVQAAPVEPKYAAMQAELIAYTRYYGGLLGLGQWTIEIRLDSLPGDFLANTLSQPKIYQALTIFDPENVAQEREPWRVVLHELLHIVTAQIHGFSFRLAGDDDQARTLVQYMFEDLVQRMAIWPVWPKPPKENK